MSNKLAVFEVGSIGITPHLVGVEHLQIVLSQSIAEVQALLVFDFFFFWISIPYVPQVTRSEFEPQKMPESIFWKLSLLLPHVPIFFRIFQGAVGAMSWSAQAFKDNVGVMSQSAQMCTDIKRQCRGNVGAMSFGSIRTHDRTHVVPEGPRLLWVLGNPNKSK